MSQESYSSSEYSDDTKTPDRELEERWHGTHTDDIGSPRRQRVRFKSLDDRPQDEDTQTFISRLRNEGQQQQRPSTPDPSTSRDVTDISLNDRAAPEDDANRPDGTEKPDTEKQDTEKPDVGNLGEKLKQTTTNPFKTIREKGQRLAERMGHGPGHETGDSLTPAHPEQNWAGGGNVPVSDMTDDKHKGDEDRRRDQATSTAEAHRLVRDLCQNQTGDRRKSRPTVRGQGTPAGLQTDADSQYRYRKGGGGVLSQLLKLQNVQQGQRGRYDSDTDIEDLQTSKPSSGTSTPKKEKLKWYKKPPNQSTSSLAGSTNLSGASTPVHSGEIMSLASKRRSKGGSMNENKLRLEDEIRVTIHIAEIIARQRFIMQLCKALMMYGAPTHRLEEYMSMTAKVLEVDAQFLYFPGCMVISFDDPSTRTTEVKLLRVAQGVNLARLADTHRVYKNVMHDIIGVEEATSELEEILNRKPRFGKWVMVLVYGLASMTIGPFAFEARPIDLPMIFVLGCLLGILQHVVAPNSALYSNVFEVFATVLNSFLARALGSIRWGVVNGKQQYLFCFSTLVQSSIALILPGFMVLCSSLELQSHQMIAGSIRMVYAIIYSLFLGYGITTGTTIYGLIDGGASSDISCPPSSINNQYLQRFPFVAITVFWIVIINKGKWKQLPVMFFIAMAGYTVNFWSTKRIGSNVQVAQSLGAFAIGTMGNLYSRLWHGHAATAILPAIFIMVPSGLASTGSLITGVQSADQIRGNVTSHGGQSGPENANGNIQQAQGNNAASNIGSGMIQVAIGITVGLFLAALVVYPYGKRRSGLFSF
ncbi:hypothetical protein DTO271D3_6796 [Paecilomyces variotii]|nr:hypothetical protein DTO271D3_6796 [Paecilomyces variotii]